MKSSDHLNLSIQAVNSIISNSLNKKIYKQQLIELQKVRSQQDGKNDHSFRSFLSSGFYLE